MHVSGQLSRSALLDPKERMRLCSSRGSAGRPSRPALCAYCGRHPRPLPASRKKYARYISINARQQYDAALTYSEYEPEGYSRTWGNGSELLHGQCNGLSSLYRVVPTCQEHSRTCDPYTPPIYSEPCIILLGKALRACTLYTIGSIATGY